MIPFQCIAAALCRWVQREQDDVIAFLREENRILKAQLRARPLRLSDPERRRLAALGHRLGRGTLADVATIVSPDTVLRWYRELVVRHSTYARCRGGRPRLHADIRLLVVRMATENATWGYTRIQGALKNLGHRLGRSTIARILKEHGVPPSQHRSMTWRTFLRAPWPALLDFVTREVSTIRGLVTYSASIIGLRSGCGGLVGSTPRPNQDFLLHRMRQFERHRWRVRAESQPDLRSRPEAARCCGPLAHVDEGPGDPGAQLQACPERFVRWRKKECLYRIEPLGSVMFDGHRRLRRTRLQRTEIVKGLGQSRASVCARNIWTVMHGLSATRRHDQLLVLAALATRTDI